MNQEKIGKFIKKLRIKNNLSQLEFAEKLGVTPQAVSKWENGKNIPDISIIKQISKEFNVNIEEIINGEEKVKKSKITLILILLFIIISIVILIILNKSSNYQFKVLSSSCDSFNISGTLSYNNQKSSIYISKINYCGGNDNTIYKKIECNLYEKNKNIENIVSKAKDGKNMKLEKYLQNVEFTIDNYNRICKKYDDRSLFLEINAYDNSDKIITYKIPLKLSETCSNLNN